MNVVRGGDKRSNVFSQITELGMESTGLELNGFKIVNATHRRYCN